LAGDELAEVALAGAPLAGAAFEAVAGAAAPGVVPPVAVVLLAGAEDGGVVESAGEFEGADESVESVVAAAGFFGPEINQLKS
jgi:hypothetical protein